MDISMLTAVQIVAATHGLIIEEDLGQGSPACSGAIGHELARLLTAINGVFDRGNFLPFQQLDAVPGHDNLFQSPTHGAD